MDYQDIRYEVRDHTATVTLDRPKVMNAFRGRTCEELIHAFQRAGYDREIGSIVLTGAGERAFCTGGDQSGHDEGGAYAGNPPAEPTQLPACKSPPQQPAQKKPRRLRSKQRLRLRWPPRKHLALLLQSQRPRLLKL